MHVLMVNYEWPGVTTNCGGGGRIAQTLADTLREHGHTVTIHTDHTDGHYATFPLRHHRDIDAAIQRHNPDVIHGQFSLPSSIGLPRLAEKHDVPLVVTAMGGDIYDPGRFTTIRPVADRLNTYIFDNADAVVAPSSDLQRRVADHTGHVPHCIHYGIQSDDWTPRTRSDNTTTKILTVARLVPRKNLETAIIAAERLRDRYPSVEYTIAGTGPRLDALKRRAETTDWLTVTGYVDDLDAVYANHDIFYLPSMYEAFGIVYLEALAAGLPIVASDTGGHTDILRHGDVGATAPPTDIDAQVGALARVIENYHDYQANTIRHLEAEFSADKMAAEYSELYRDIAQPELIVKGPDADVVRREVARR